jgi:chromosome segregation ATPase
MYPIKMRISGIRDFLPREMDLGMDDEHVLVGGKNGSGKSTLVYAMSYSLVSGRVDIDGLRSKNIKRDTDPWRAHVSILFRNPHGEGQCDAPEYVELAVDIKSVAGRESIKATYVLNGGDLPDKLMRMKKFQSHDDARAYYKRVFNIDADGYFMFWHQGAIARFANMADHERFKQVAEMFGLDQIQQEWVEAQRLMTQAEEEFSSARHYANVQQRRLQELETRKNKLEQRDEDRKSALLRHTAYSLELADLARKEWEIVIEEFNALTKQYEITEIESTELEAKLERAEECLSDAKLKVDNLKSQREAVVFSIKRRQDELKEVTKTSNLLHEKIADIRERIKNIRRSKSDLLVERGRLENIMLTADASILSLNNEQEILSASSRDLISQIALLEQEYTLLQSIIQELETADIELADEATLRKLVATYNEQYESLFREKQTLTGEVQRLNKEFERLCNQKTLLLPEQEKLLNIYRESGIEAVAFGELFEAKDDTQRETIETIFNPLKHTVFVGQILKNLPLNKAFYVVPLEEKLEPSAETECKSPIFEYLRMVPQVEEDLSAKFLNGINQWLGRIVLEQGEKPTHSEGHLSLWKGTLWDSFGGRGVVEPGDAIGIRAIENAREKVADLLIQAEESLRTTTLKLEEIDQKRKLEEKNLEQRLRVDNNLPAKKHEFVLIEQKLPPIREEENGVANRQKAIVDEILAKCSEKENADRLLGQVNGEISVHEEYEQHSEDVDKLIELEKKINDLNTIIEQDEIERDELTEQINEMGINIPEITESRNALKAEYHGIESQLEQLFNKKESSKEKALTLEDEAEQWENEFTRIQDEYEPIIDSLRLSGRWIVPFVPEKEKEVKTIMENRMRDAKRDLQDADAQVVDEKARENYDVFLVEFEVAKKQMYESELRFEKLKAVEQERRDRFTKAVYMRWERTNSLFCQYMKQLGMVGQIKNIPPDENERNPQYKWELHVATQVGHNLEKVEPESTKRVGKGISGGERAATSLIFALALLSDIENKPPFYVLDEFDSALDEERKHQLFDMYRSILGRKLIIVSPKIHGDQYLNRFGKFHCVVANPAIEPGKNISEVYDVSREQYLQMPLDADEESIGA